LDEHRILRQNHLFLLYEPLGLKPDLGAAVCIHLGSIGRRAVVDSTHVPTPVPEGVAHYDPKSTFIRVDRARGQAKPHNRETQPQLWAETEVDMGITDDELGIRVEGKAGNEHLAAAVIAYRSALEVYTREQLPQDWAGTQNDLGAALRDQAARTEGTKGAELLAQAVSACRSALEVYTRQELPQDWAETQKDLANALFDQAARTEGPKGAELFAQAVIAYRSALEVYSAEAFPLFHEKTEKQLKECERLLTQAKLKLNKVKQRSQ
jgi:hypothetical protein